jgi:hypothetical protein
MSLFQREPRPVDVTSTINAQREGEDIKSGANDFIADAIARANIAEAHLWEMHEDTQVALAGAATAYGADVISEMFLDHKEQQRRGIVLPPDAARFAANLAWYAKDKMAEIRTPRPDDALWIFDEESRGLLSPDSQLPKWPIDYEGAKLDEWDWRGTAEEAGVVSSTFVRAVTGIGLAFYTKTDMAAAELPGLLVAQAPAELASTFDIVNSILADGLENLQAADAIMGPEEKAKIKQAARSEPYHLAHSGLIAVMTANMALVAPPILGPDFRNE